MRDGNQNGTREMTELLKLTRQFDQERLRLAIETALETGCTDAAAVQHLLQVEVARWREVLSAVASRDGTGCVR